MEGPLTLTTAAVRSSVLTYGGFDESTDVATKIKDMAPSIVKAIIGAGVFALSSNLSKSSTGLAAGLVCLVVIGLATATSFCLVGLATDDIDSTGYECATQNELWQKSVGHGKLAVDMATLCMGFLSLTQFTTTLNDLFGAQFGRVFGGSELKRRLAVAITVLPLCLARDLSALKHTSMLGFAAVIYSAGFVAVRCIDGSYHPGGKFYGLPTGADLAGIAKVSPAPPIGAWAFGWGSLSYVGSLNTAYNNHLNVPAYWRTFAKGSVDRLATRRGFKLLTYLSFGFAALVYMIVLTCGTFTFRDVGLQGLLLLQYAAADPGAQIMRFATLLSVLTCFPLFFQNLRDIAASVFLRKAKPEPNEKSAVAMVLLALISTASVFAQDAAQILAINGSLMGNLVIFTLPAIYSIAARRRAGDNAIGGPLKQHTMAALIALALYGAVSSVLGTKAALKNS